MRSAAGGSRGIGTTKKTPRLPAGAKTMSRIRAVTSNTALRMGSSRMNLTNAIVPPTHIATKTSVDSASAPLRSESSSFSKTAARQHHKHVSRTAAATMRHVRDVMAKIYSIPPDASAFQLEFSAPNCQGLTARRTTALNRACSAVAIDHSRARGNAKSSARRANLSPRVAHPKRRHNSYPRSKMAGVRSFCSSCVSLGVAAKSQQVHQG